MILHDYMLNLYMILPDLQSRKLCLAWQFVFLHVKMKTVTCRKPVLLTSHVLPRVPGSLDWFDSWWPHTLHVKSLGEYSHDHVCIVVYHIVVLYIVQLQG